MPPTHLETALLTAINEHNEAIRGEFAALRTSFDRMADRWFYLIVLLVVGVLMFAGIDATNVAKAVLTTMAGN